MTADRHQHEGSPMPAQLKQNGLTSHRTAASLLAWVLGAAVLGYVAWLAAHHMGASDPFSVRMRAALGGSALAAAATALGTLPVLLAQSYSQRSYDSFLGFGAGVMLGATAFSLVIPALQAARQGGATPMEASLMIGAGIAFGTVLIVALGRLLHTRVEAGPPDAATAAAYGYRRVWLFIAAITLHNLPEGLAIGVAYAGADIERAHALATGIAIQDVPEGLVVALALRSVGYGRWFSAGMGVVSGLVEPLAAVAGVGLISVSAGLLPIGLAAAAGAMLYVIVHEVIPASHSQGNGAWASRALVTGFIVMTVLDTAMA
jgi:ZIP family zinc transporter